MSVVKVSDLPKIKSIGDPDVLMVNDRDITTSGILFTDFVGSFTNRDLEFSGDIEYTGEVTFEGEAIFNKDVEYNGEVTFNGGIIVSGGVSITLGQLADVLIDPALLRNDHALIYNIFTQKWENKFITFDSIDEIDVVAPQNGDILVYDLSSRKWRNATNTGGGGGGGGGGGIDFTDLSVTTATPKDGGELSYNNAGRFTFRPADLSGLGGQGIELTDLSVKTVTASGGGTLTYNDTKGEFSFAPANLSGVKPNIPFHPIAPSAPAVGDVWINSSTYKMYVYNGSWIQLQN